MQVSVWILNGLTYIIKHHQNKTDSCISALSNFKKSPEKHPLWIDFLPSLYLISVAPEMPNEEESQFEAWSHTEVFFFLLSVTSNLSSLKFLGMVARVEWLMMKLKSLVSFVHTSAAGVSLRDRIVAVRIHRGVALGGEDSQ